MIFFVAPAYNEEKNVGRFVDEVAAYARRKGWDWRLIVVDDGSQDRTAEIVREKIQTLPCVLVSYQPNKGVGEAFRRGFHKALALAEESDVIVSLESDGTGDLNLLPAFLEKIESGADAVLASYYAGGGKVEGTAWHRRFLSRSANLTVRGLFRLKGVHTYSSFYRAYRPAALRAVLSRYRDFFNEKGFACVVELLVRLHRLGCPIEEVPMALQGNKRVGKSKMKVLQTIWGYFCIAARAALRPSE